MEKQEIIATLKENYNRDLRKQVVKTILGQEKESSTPNYQVINQIFTYVIKELNWKIEENIQDWDTTPLDIMEEAFPKIESTKWYEEQLLALKKIMAGEIKDDYPTK